MLSKYKNTSSPKVKKMPIARKLASSLAVAALLFSSVNPGAFAAEITNVQTVASFKDINGHWAQSPIGKWASSGIINGYTDGTFLPNGKVTRAEFVAVLNRLFGFSQQTSNSFNDVPSGKWYAADVLIAHQAGYFEGFAGNLAKPENYLTRQDAATMLARVFELNQASTSPLTFSDAASISAYAASAVGILTQKGAINGYTDGTFKPTGSITRAEVIKIIDGMAKGYYNAAGTYGDATIAGSALITASGAILSGSKVSGDLYLTAGIGNGEATLDQVTVSGTTFVSGGGIDSIHLKSSTLSSVTINKQGGKVRVVADGSTAIESMEILVPTVIVINDGAKVGTITIRPGAEGTTITGGKNVTSIVVQTAGVIIDGKEVGQGTITNDGKDTATKPTSSPTTSGGNSGSGSNNGGSSTKWSQSIVGTIGTVTNPDGETLGYSTQSGVTLLTVDGLAFKDLNKNGKLDKYEDWRLSTEVRAKDLASQMSVEQIAGLMLYSGHQSIPAASASGFRGGTYGGKPLAESGALASDLTDQQKVFLTEDNLRHVLITTVESPEVAARWNNNAQALVEKIGLGIPANNSSDPRHSTVANAEYNEGSGGAISMWPQALGLAASFDANLTKQFGEIAAKEYRALGIATALSPQVDMSSEPRWTRFSGTFGEDSTLSADMARAYVDGFQTTPGSSDGWGNESVNAMVKHWPGGGSGESGRDAHYGYGKYAVYPGNNFDEHLIPFTKGAFDLEGPTGKAAAVMPYYTISFNQDKANGENVGNSYSPYVITDLLRNTYHYDGVITTDWGITGDEGPVELFGNRPWGVEDNYTVAERHYRIIMAGVDQFGGNNDSKPIIAAYQIGIEKQGEKVIRTRFEESAVRLLTNIFNAGLFENPYLDVEETKATVGNKEFMTAGYMAQLKSVIMLKNKDNNILPLKKDEKVYVPKTYDAATKSYSYPVNIDQLKKYFNVTDDPAQADSAIVFIKNPQTGAGYSKADADAGGNGYIPISLQYHPYTAEYARETSLAGDARDVLNRSYKGKKTTASNESDLDLVLDTKKAMGDKPVVVSLTMSNPTIVAEFEDRADAIIANFGIQNQAIFDVLVGAYEPSALLPMQMPKDMKTVEEQYEDVSHDMKVYVDSEGNAYDFAFGMNWSGVINDARTVKYKKAVNPGTDPEEGLIAAPTASIPSGTYYGTQTVMLTAPSGTTIFYTTDGSAPAASVMNTTKQYNSRSGISITASSIVKALTVKDGKTSKVAEFNYIIGAALPTAVPEPGVYKSGPQVTLTSTSGATIYYTLDGSTPTENSTVYQGPITIVGADKETVTIKALAVKAGIPSSPIAELKYTIDANLVVLTDEASIDAVIGEMTLKEKASLVVGAGSGTKVAGAAGGSYELPRLGIPKLIMADGPAGVRINTKQGEDTTFATGFPIATSIAATWNEVLAMQVGNAMGNELLEYGVDLYLAPALNIHRNPLGGRNFEYYSEDPLISGKMTAAITNGVQANGVGTTIKHFAANNQETNRMSIDTVVSERALREIYLKGFEIAVEESQPWSVMSSYNKINGIFASENKDLLSTILRDEWGFQGFVMTDWGGGSNRAQNMIAGNDLIMPGNATAISAITKAVNDGDLSLEQLDVNVKRILKVVVKSPSFKGIGHSNQPDLTANAVTSRQAATEGMVLLENKAEALPIAAGTNIALFGNAQIETVKGGTGSGDVNVEHTVSIVEGLSDAGYSVYEPLNVSYQEYITELRKKPEYGPVSSFGGLAYPPLPEKVLSADEITSAEASSVMGIIVISRISGEGADRKNAEGDFLLTATELDMIDKVSTAYHEQGKKVSVILNIGGPIEMISWKDKVDAILLAWQPGQEAGHAIADVLSGAVNPSGKLPMTFPTSYGVVPSANNFPGNSTEVKYEEDIYVGYRYYDTFGKSSAVAYPFGYGLSYTTFGYRDLKISSDAFDSAAGSVTVTVDVYNNGPVAGKEVVQLYLSAPGANKPVQELKAFQKTVLLNAGEQQTLTFTLNSMDLASFNESIHAWVADPGTYAVRIASSSAAEKLNTYFQLESPMTVKTTNSALIPVKPLNLLVHPVIADYSQEALTVEP